MLRASLTDAERRLWNRLRRKQILGVQFYRQEPIGNYIVDFYAPATRLVVEVDGAHHTDPCEREGPMHRCSHDFSNVLFIVLSERLGDLQNQRAI